MPLKSINQSYYFYMETTYQIQIVLSRPIWPIDRTLTGTKTPGQNGLGSTGNEERLHTLQITIKYSLVSYPGHPFLGESNSSAGDTITIF